jgi:hypothetical protein
MAFRTWVRLLLATLGMAALAGASQLGLAYGLGIVRLTRVLTVTTRDQWTAQLAWVAWFSMTAAVVGALAGSWLLPRWDPALRARTIEPGPEVPTGSTGSPGSQVPTGSVAATGSVAPTGSVARTGSVAARVDRPTPGAGTIIAVAVAAGIGAGVVAPLTMQPARQAQVAGVDPVLVIAICATLGAIAGIFAACAALATAVARWSFVTLGIAVWVVAVVSVSPSLAPSDPFPDVRLGVFDASFLSTSTTQRAALITMPALALLAGLALGWRARRQGRGTLTIALAGLPGPALLTVAYLLAGPGDGTARYEIVPYWAAMTAAGAGVLGSVLAAVLRRGPGPEGPDDDDDEMPDDRPPLPRRTSRSEESAIAQASAPPEPAAAPQPQSPPQAKPVVQPQSQPPTQPKGQTLSQPQAQPPSPEPTSGPTASSGRAASTKRASSGGRASSSGRAASVERAASGGPSAPTGRAAVAGGPWAEPAGPSAERPGPGRPGVEDTGIFDAPSGQVRRAPGGHGSLTAPWSPTASTGAAPGTGSASVPVTRMPSVAAAFSPRPGQGMPNRPESISRPEPWQTGPTGDRPGGVALGEYTEPEPPAFDGFARAKTEAPRPAAGNAYGTGTGTGTGFAAAQTNRPSDPQTSRATAQQTSRASAPQPSRPSEQQSSRPSDLQSNRPSDLQSSRPADQPYVPEPATRPLPPEVLGGIPTAERGGALSRGLRSIGRSRHAAEPEPISAPLPTPTPITPPLPNPQPLRPIAQPSEAPDNFRPVPAPRVQLDDTRAGSPPAAAPEPSPGGRRFGRKRKDATEYVDWVSGLGND